MTGERSDQERQRCVLQVSPFQVALSEKHRRRAAPAKRAAAGVLNDGVCDVDASVSAQSGAVREIDIFVHHEKVFIESAKFDENVPPDHAGSAAGTKYLTRIVAECERVPVESLECPACAKIAIACAVNDRRVVQIDDPGCRESHTRI